MGDCVVASVAYWGCGGLVRRTVESILGQTHRNLLCVVVNDGDRADPPWPYLADIDDPRLVRFDLGVNRGRYWADAVIMAALEPDWFALADPDDWSEPRRFEVALEAAVDGVAFGPWWIHRRHGLPFVQRRLHRLPRRDNVVHHGGYGAGVISGERIADAGGFHPGFRVSWDTLLLNAVKLRGRYGVFHEPLAHKTIRDGSLYTSAETGAASAHRRAAHAHRLALWQLMWDRNARGDDIASVVRDDAEALWPDVAVDAKRLRKLLDV